MKSRKKWLAFLVLCISTIAVGGLVSCDKGENTDGQINEETDESLGDTGENNSGENNSGGEENVCTVTFDSDGGSVVQAQAVERGGKVNLPLDPEKNDCIFLGWYCDGVKWSFENGTVERDITLKAVWVDAQSTVTVEKNVEHGGIVSGAGTFGYGESRTIKAETSLGYTFLGWYKGDAKITDNTRLTFRVLGDVTYTAKWMECPVTLTNTDESSGTVDGLEKTTIAKQTTITATPNAGYTFVGWYNEDTLITENETYSFAITENMKPITYTAKWTSYTLTTESDFGIAGEYSAYTNQKITAGERTSLTVKPNDNYTFLGWYNGEEKLTENETYTFTMPKENITYTAKWEDGWKELEGYNYWTFSQLGRDVMPIVGFNTPNASSADLGRTEGEVSQISLESYQMMKDCGFNVACGWWNDWNGVALHDDIKSELDYAEQVGMVYIVHHNKALKTTSENDFAAYQEYMSKPAYGGTIIIDEPGAVNFADIAKATAVWKNSAYKDTLAYVNNLPNYAQMWQLEDCQGTGGSYQGSFSNYQEWLQLYLNTVKPQVFSYDYYPYHYNDASFFRDGWFENLSNVRYYTAKANVPFWVYGQVGVWKEYGASEVRRKLSYGETAFQYNTMLAYGAKGIQYYNYFTPPNYTVENGYTACVTTKGEKTDYYDYVQKINRQISAVDHVLMMSKWQGVIPINQSMSPISAGDVLSSYGALTGATGVGDAIVGCFEYRDIGYAYYIASNNVHTGATVTLQFDGTYNLTKVQDATETQSTGNSISVSLPAGEGVLIVVPKNK